MSAQNAEQWHANAPYAVFLPNGCESFEAHVGSGHLDGEAIKANARQIRDREFHIFGEAIPKTGAWPWSKDWRLGFEWQPTYFRSYNHKASKPEPREVKFPWELSRLSFLPVLLQAELIEPTAGFADSAFEILADWDAANPLAYSVNWYPMEAAMRGIQLCLLADMSRQCGIPSEKLTRLMRMLAEHGEFIRRTIEYTDNAGNHYVAELAALLLIGRTLSNHYAPARRWFSFAASRVEREIKRQILPDGVDFEKSTAYHRLVTDLFLLISLCLERSNCPLHETSMQRLRAAVQFNAMFIRPDGYSPLVGDSDDAVVFDFDMADVRDHACDLAFATLCLRVGELPAPLRFSASSLSWFFGERVVAANHDAAPRLRQAQEYFADGGFVVSKNDHHYLFVDVGEVGQNGTGGHGHNDILSFELCLAGKPTIVDPGSYMYSGDYAAHDRFRSTAAHNTLMVDETEIAPFTGYFRISNQARPIDVEVIQLGHVTEIRAGHTGYSFMEDPVICRREFRFDREAAQLICGDHLECSAKHLVQRRFHFAPDIELEMHGDQLQFLAGEVCFRVRWDADSRATLMQDEISPGFGQIESSQTLQLDTDIDGSSKLYFEIAPV